MLQRRHHQSMTTSSKNYEFEKHIEDTTYAQKFCLLLFFNKLYQQVISRGILLPSCPLLQNRLSKTTPNIQLKTRSHAMLSSEVE